MPSYRKTARPQYRRNSELKPRMLKESFVAVPHQTVLAQDAAPREPARYVAEKVAELAGKLGLNLEGFGVRFIDASARLARVRFNEDQLPQLEVNRKILDQLATADVNLARQFIDYGLAHELVHIKQFLQSGLAGMKALPRWILEERAEKEALLLLGKSSDALDKIVQELNQKIAKTL
jgi:hypothetical protein